MRRRRWRLVHFEKVVRPIYVMNRYIHKHVSYNGKTEPAFKLKVTFFKCEQKVVGFWDLPRQVETIYHCSFSWCFVITLRFFALFLNFSTFLAVAIRTCSTTGLAMTFSKCYETSKITHETALKLEKKSCRWVEHQTSLRLKSTFSEVASA